MSDTPFVIVLLIPAPLSSPDGAAFCGHLDMVAEQVSVYTGLSPRVVPLEWVVDVTESNTEDCVKFLTESLADLASDSRVFFFPVVVDFTVFHQQALAELVSRLRKEYPGLALHYDDPDPMYPVAAQAWSAYCHAELGKIGPPSADLAVLLLSSGLGDSSSRAKAYGLMRLLWESIGAGHGTVAFVRHQTHHILPATKMLPITIQRVLVIPQAVVTEPWLAMGGDALRGAAGEMPGVRFSVMKPWAFQDSIRVWLVDRVVNLWRSHQNKMEVHIRSAKGQSAVNRNVLFTRTGTEALGKGEVSETSRWGNASIGRIYDAEGLRGQLSPLLRRDVPTFIKATWHGYATGTFSDARALDVLLEALPGRTVVMEGHTTSRNVGGSDWDWETDAQAHRRWIWEQDAEFRKRTGIQDVLDKHRAQYLNVTETFWDGGCADRDAVLGHLSEQGIRLNEEEIAGFIPQAVWENRGANFVSFARFKGPTRLSISNCFGLLPDTLRSRWHGPNLTYMARICCDMVQLYQGLLNGVAVVEGLHTAIRWDRQGLYRSRWGNYDIVPDPALVVASNSFGDCDAMACRLQGHDVERSAFFDVVKSMLGVDEGVRSGTLPSAVSTILL